MTLEQRPAYWTYDARAFAEIGEHLYYFGPIDRTKPPYRQVHVTAVVDVASDGTLAGIELAVGPLPLPPLPVSPTPAGEWHDISNAPKDGTRIICAVTEPFPVVAECHWGLCQQQHSENISKHGWINCNGSYFGATHWRPLPSPPASKSDEP